MVKNTKISNKPIFQIKDVEKEVKTESRKLPNFFKQVQKKSKKQQEKALEKCK